jgi:hypothetical protein
MKFQWPHRLRRNLVLGVDIGSDGVRFALLRRRGGQIRLEDAFEISLTQMQGFVDFDVVYEKIAPELEARSLPQASMATLPPWGAERLWIEEMPEMAPERFAKAAEWFFKRSDGEGLTNPVNQAIA